MHVALFLQTLSMTLAVALLWNPRSKGAWAAGFGFLSLSFCWAMVLGAWVTLRQMAL